ncbi:MAG: hypothetical protein EPO12_15760 [Aquabacterium sp.]|jgi:hypothetical protein|nr:MAG: hypothetical protein EPO12_15760 [Aquabacterium sp.]
MKLEALKKVTGPIDALSRRDRMVLLAGLVAGLVALDVQVVLGMRERRVAAEQAQAAQPVTDQAQIAAAAREERAARLKDIQKKLEQRHKELAQQGLASPPQAIFEELRKTLALPGVQVLSLKALPDVADNEPVAEAASSPQIAGSEGEGQPAAAAPATPPPVYRHRTEVRIAGPLAEVSRIVQSFERPTLPLRLERVRFSAAADPSKVEAWFVLLTIGQDHTWLAL